MPQFFQPKYTALLAAICGLMLAGQGHATELKLRPEGKDLTRTVEALLAELAPTGTGLELKLSTAGSGPRVVWGNASGVPFNPDLVARTSGRGSSRLIELNPAGPLNRTEALRQVLQGEFELGEWTPEAARLRFSGADLNADGRVDLTDLALMMEAYGGTGRGDLNDDRRVDRADLDLFGNSYRILPLATPEPRKSEPEKPEPAKAKPAQPTPAMPPAQPSEPDAEEIGTKPPEGAAIEEPQPEDNPEPPQAEPTELIPAEPTPDVPNPDVPNPDTPAPDDPTESGMPAPPTP